MNLPQENRIEDAIDQTLTALRDAPVPQGIEHRILHALEDPAITHSQSWLSLLMRRSSAAYGLAAAAVVALVFILMTPSSLRNPAKQARSRAELQPSENPSKSSRPEAASLSATSNLASSKPSVAMRHKRLHGVHAITPVRTTESANQSPGFPPPPLPLTRQEKLLLQITQTRPPVELIQLSSVRQTAEEERERVEFERFFTPPDPETPKTNQSE